MHLLQMWEAQTTTLDTFLVLQVAEVMQVVLVVFVLHLQLLFQKEKGLVIHLRPMVFLKGIILILTMLLTKLVINWEQTILFLMVLKVQMLIWSLDLVQPLWGMRESQELIRMFRLIRMHIFTKQVLDRFKLI